MYVQRVLFMNAPNPFPSSRIIGIAERFLFVADRFIAEFNPSLKGEMGVHYDVFAPSQFYLHEASSELWGIQSPLAKYAGTQEGRLDMLIGFQPFDLIRYSIAALRCQPVKHDLLIHFDRSFWKSDIAISDKGERIESSEGEIKSLFEAYANAWEIGVEIIDG